MEFRRSYNSGYNSIDERYTNIIGGGNVVRSSNVPVIGGIYLMETVVDGAIKHKPVIVISNNEFNKGPYVYICPLTTDPKDRSATVFKTWATGVESSAVMNNLRSVDKSKLIEYVGQLSNVEEQSMADCICNLFGINTLQLPDSLKESSVGIDPDKDKQLACLEDALKAERRRSDDLIKEIEFHKRQYDLLLDKFLNRVG